MCLFHAITPVGRPVIFAPPPPLSACSYELCFALVDVFLLDGPPCNLIAGVGPRIVLVPRYLSINFQHASACFAKRALKCRSDRVAEVAFFCVTSMAAKSHRGAPSPANCMVESERKHASQWTQDENKPMACCSQWPAFGSRLTGGEPWDVDSSWNATSGVFGSHYGQKLAWP